MDALQNKLRQCRSLVEQARLVPDHLWSDTGRGLFVGMSPCETHWWRYDVQEEGGDVIATRCCVTCGLLQDADLLGWLEFVSNDEAA